MTTQSEPTGTPRIDIEIMAESRETSLVSGKTPRGWLWMRNNLTMHFMMPVRISSEFQEELVDLITKEGLRVLER